MPRPKNRTLYSYNPCMENRSVLRIFFGGRGALQDVYREWPTSRFGAV